MDEMNMRARELLAAEYERAGQLYEARALRDGGTADTFLNDKDIQVALRAIEAALQSLAPAGWRDIASAPRGGRILVAGTEIGMCVASAGWRNETPHEIQWEVVNDIRVTPTHWQPLPPTPQPRTDAEEN